MNNPGVEDSWESNPDPLAPGSGNSHRGVSLESSATPGSQPRLWQFILYRLFSLSGLIPVGGYVCVHLLTNLTVLGGAAPFQKNVNLIHSLGPALPFVEWAFIFGPMLFHAAVGFLIISGAVVNVGSYPYGSNIRYTLQRATGVIAFAFIVWHIMHLHHYGSLIDKTHLGQFDPERAGSSAAAALSTMTQKLIYAIGITAVTFHFANGLWTQGITWGIWTSRNAMRRAGYLCTAIGVGLFCVGIGALIGMSSLDQDKARAIEQNIETQKRLLNGEDLSKESPAPSRPATK